MMDYNILREHDIRGEYPKQINAKVAYKIGQAFGTYLAQKKINTCLIGYDNRLSSEELQTALTKGVLDTGTNVVNIGLSTTPLFNYSSILAEMPYGIMLTASHNPASDNGFKIFGENYLHLEHAELSKVYELIKNENFCVGKGQLSHEKYDNAYVRMLIEKTNLKKRLKVVIDCGNGTTSILVKRIFGKLNLDVTYLNAESDGAFPVHNPDPNDPKNLKWLQEKILELKADVGIGFDGDGDRVGIVDEKGNMLATDILIAIFAKDIAARYDKKDIIYDVKCSRALEIELKNIGANGLIKKNGSAYIETQMYKNRVLFGGEYSGHVFFADDYFGYDDGIYAGLRMVELLSGTEKKCSALYEHMEKFYNTPEIRVEVDDNQKWDIIEKIKDYALNKHQEVLMITGEDIEVLTIDGVRVNYPDGFSLIRCSNTSPQITLRFEAKTEKELEVRQTEYMNLLNSLIK